MKFFLKCSFIEKSAVIVFILLFSVIILSPWLAPYDPNAINMQVRLTAPSLQHWFGTDSLGRDELSRLMYGGATSLFIAVLATFISSIVIGLSVGIITGLKGGFFDDCVTMITSIFQGIPSTAFLIAIAGVMGPGIQSLIVGISITAWPEFSRLARANVMSLKRKAFIQASEGFGAGRFRLVFLHILPNMKETVIVLTSTRIARTLLTIAALNFLGLGVQPPTPDWGVMANEARPYMHRAAYLFYFPTGMIFLAAWSINTIGNALSEYWNSSKDQFEV